MTKMLLKNALISVLLFVGVCLLFDVFYVVVELINQ